MWSFHPDHLLCDNISSVTRNMADFSVRFRVKTQRSQLPGEKGVESEFLVYSRAFPLPGPWPLTTLCRIFPSSSSFLPHSCIFTVKILALNCQCVYSFVQFHNSYKYAVLCLVAQLCPTRCSLMDSNLIGSSVFEILQARILEWVAMSPCRRFSQTRDWI